MTFSRTALLSGVPVTPAHRHDLDGLRGVAIALVVVFHVWLGRVSGGVDVFLVLSGYFFVGALIRRAERSASVDPRPSLGRVARRLLPMLALTTVITVAAFAAQSPRTQWADLLRQGLTTITFVQNWALAFTSSDYSRAGSAVSPLQHVWSMAIQGQFYLLAIAVVGVASLAAARFGLSVRRILAVTTVSGAVASFGYAAVASGRYQSWAYYDTAARLWELLIGAALAATAIRPDLPRAVRTSIACAGLAAIGLCGVFLDGAGQFPGPWALVPVLGAVALILAGDSSPSAPNPVSRVLGSTALTWLGSIAYPLYLFHWPILIGALAWTGRAEAGLRVGLLVVASSMLLAHVAVRLIDGSVAVPGPSRTAVMTCTSVVVVALVGAPAAWSAYVSSAVADGRPVDSLNLATHPGAASLFADAPVPDARMTPSVFDADNDVPESTDDGCIADILVREVLRCSYGDRSASRVVALVGGSHSEHWLTAFAEIGRTTGFRVDTYLKVGCPLTLDVMPSFAGNDYPDCQDWSKAALDALSADRPDVVVTTSTRPRQDGPGDTTPDFYVSAWRALSERGLRTVAIRDTPWLTVDTIPFRAVDCLSDGGNEDSCGMPRTSVLSAVDPAIDATAGLPMVTPIDLSDAVCAPHVCRAAEGNVLVYRDAHHLTASYVRTLVPELSRKFASATGW